MMAAVLAPSTWCYGRACRTSSAPGSGLKVRPLVCSFGCSLFAMPYRFERPVLLLLTVRSMAWRRYTRVSERDRCVLGTRATTARFSQHHLSQVSASLQKGTSERLRLRARSRALLTRACGRAVLQISKQPEWLSVGGTLRDYQLTGLNWLVYCWSENRNCILADEMYVPSTNSCSFSLSLSRTGRFVFVLPCIESHTRAHTHTQGPWQDCTNNLVPVVHSVPLQHTGPVLGRGAALDRRQLDEGVQEVGPQHERRTWAPHSHRIVLPRG